MEHRQRLRLSPSHTVFFVLEHIRLAESCHRNYIYHGGQIKIVDNSSLAVFVSMSPCFCSGWIGKEGKKI